MSSFTSSVALRRLGSRALRLRWVREDEGAELDDSVVV